MDITISKDGKTEISKPFDTTYRAAGSDILPQKQEATKTKFGTRKQTVDTNNMNMVYCCFLLLKCGRLCNFGLEKKQLNAINRLQRLKGCSGRKLEESKC